MIDVAIRAEHLTRDFESVRAVDDLSLTVPAGTVFGFLGPNGAGKTTTIRLLLGLLEPSAGRAEVLGFDTRDRSADIRLRSGALFEFEGLYERLSAEDNLEFYGRVWRMPAAERRARIKELLTRFGLWERRREAVRKWSRGMRRKLGVARAVLHRPPLIFLDEPTAGLDPVATAALREDLAALAAREGVTIFLTTHNLFEAERLCDAVGVIRQGRLRAVGSLDELRAAAGGVRAEIVGRGLTAELAGRVREIADVSAVELADGRMTVGLAGKAASVAPLVSLLVGAGAEIEEVRKSRPTLEEVFLAIMGGEAA